MAPRLCIRERLTAAACFLPLTTNQQLSSQFGTRHRAAIGITEETDCLSLVVSEETGRISVASFGDLYAGLTIQEVAARIAVHFESPQAGPTHIDESTGDIPLQDSRPVPDPR